MFAGHAVRPAVGESSAWGQSRVCDLFMENGRLRKDWSGFWEAYIVMESNCANNQPLAPFCHNLLMVRPERRVVVDIPPAEPVDIYLPKSITLKTPLLVTEGFLATKY